MFEKCMFSCPQIPRRLLTGQCAVAWPHSFTSSWFERVCWIQAEVFSPKGLFCYFYDASQLYLWCCSPSQNLTAPICGSQGSPYSTDEGHWVKSHFTRQPALYHFPIFFSWIKNAFLAYCTQTNAVLGGSLSGSWSNELWLSEWLSQLWIPGWALSIDLLCGHRQPAHIFLSPLFPLLLLLHGDNYTTQTLFPVPY